MSARLLPKYPIFIPTKGRYQNPLTIRAFEKIGIPYTAVVEKQEEQKYRQVVKQGDVLCVPHSDEGVTKTRNWIWEYVKERGNKRYWSFDDNIRCFYRLHRNMKYRLKTPAFVRCMEDFADRYKNVAIAGMQYELFVPRKRKTKPFLLNTRVYSNMLHDTEMPFRYETFFNEDTDLCLRVLKAGYCTVLFQAFLADKVATMTMKGGNTGEYAKTNNRREFAEELRRAHPDVVKVIKKWGRWHHLVDYKPFRKNRLIRRADAVVHPGMDYGMQLVTGTAQ